MFDNGLYALTAIMRACAYESDKGDGSDAGHAHADETDRRDGTDHV